MKKFFAEFKKFITRGNVVDMAVGVIVGSSFTAIVNGMSNFILKPIINWLLALIFGKDSLSELYTYLRKTLDPVTGEIVVADSIYIDWGAFINAVINFFLVAFVLFVIVKIINRIRDKQKAFVGEIKKYRPTKEEKREMKARGINYRNKEALFTYYAEKEKAAEEEAAKAKAEEEEKARLEREANPTTEDLLKKILALMEGRNA